MWILLFVAAALCSSAYGQACQSQFVAYDGSCYHFSATQLDWFDADEYCTSFRVSNYSSCHLVTIESYAEDTWVAERIRADSDFNSRDVWIGGSQVDKNVQGLVWISNYRSFSYANWSPSRPSSSGKCAYMNSFYSLRWDNNDCDDRRSFVCEYRPAGLEKDVMMPKVEEQAPAMAPVVKETKQACSPGFITNGNSCYYFIPSSLNWYDADQYCTYVLPGTSYQVHLAAIESATEQNFIAGYINADSELRGRNYWISLNLLDKKRGWHWASTNQAATYTAWASGEPDLSGLCVFMYQSQNYLWDDYNCEAESAGFTNLGFVCEYEM